MRCYGYMFMSQVCGKMRPVQHVEDRAWRFWFHPLNFINRYENKIVLNYVSQNSINDDPETSITVWVAENNSIRTSFE